MVYRLTQAEADGAERRADSYYYTPTGKKLRSLREISAFREYLHTATENQISQLLGRFLDVSTRCPEVNARLFHRY